MPQPANPSAGPSAGPDGPEKGILTHPDRHFLTEIGDDPERIAFELREFSESAQLLSERWERLAEEHPMEWVCFHRGEVSASSKSLDGLMAAMKERGIPANRAAVRFIDKKQKTLIL